MVKYLLDFGKRRVIPDIVKKYGSLVEESSSERKKYWLAECYVPLHLLKNFEEKRISRKSNEPKCGELLEVDRVKTRTWRTRGFSYLFSKAERSDYYQCVHCNRDVLIRYLILIVVCYSFPAYDILFLHLIILLLTLDVRLLHSTTITIK